LSALSATRRALSSQREHLKPMLDLSPLTKQEELEKKLEGEVNELERSLMKISGDLKFIESNLDSTLKPEYVRAKLDLKMLDKQTATFQDRIQEYNQELQKHVKKIGELESARDKMYNDLASVRTERKKLEDNLQTVESQLNKLDSEYEPLTDSLHKLDLEHHEQKTEIGYLERELAGIGYGEVIIKPEEFEYVESTLTDLQKELQALGSVNQLAIYQYDGLKNNYKHLSKRINQLEEEKKSIMTFIDELEKKKIATFMTAYNKINSNFKALFSKLTGGGDGWLQLQNPEDPLSEGIDVFVQFPGKSPRLVAGASGGEKSVVAVSFILALQRLSAVPFYVFDEIDAHLDSYNAERLADLLVEESQDSQFIVISLRDVMINRFDKIFGVYSDDGVSKVISLDIKEVPAA
jgi:chromosome segregation protein